MDNKIFLLILLLLSACTGPQAPTKSNFKKAVQQYLSQKKACVNVSANFPVQVPKSEPPTPGILDEFVAIGFLTAEETRIKLSKYDLDRSWENKPATTYSLTSKGQQEAKKPGRDFFGGTNFCYGDYEIVDITNFTDPADFFGQKVSHVNYTYRVINIADWSKNDQLRAKYADLARALDSASTPLQDNAAVVLTNDGWQHEVIFRKNFRG